MFGQIVQYTYFDLKYLMGGSEKGVKETFVTCTPLHTAARQIAPRDMFTVQLAEVGRRSMQARRSRFAHYCIAFVPLHCSPSASALVVVAPASDADADTVVLAACDSEDVVAVICC